MGATHTHTHTHSSVSWALRDALMDTYPSAYAHTPLYILAHTRIPPLYILAHTRIPPLYILAHTRTVYTVRYIS
jgi:hypothetical protein